MSKLRVGIVGCGIISEWHVRAYAAHRDRAEIVVCCDTNLARAESRAAEVGARATTSFEEALDSVDAVDLLTPHHLHKEQTLAALAAGKHVLLQKPLAHNLEDSIAIVDAAEPSATVLYYGEFRHTEASTLAAQKAVREGRIGRLVGTQAIYANWQGGDYLSTSWRYTPSLAGGGQLLDGGIHHIALMEAVGGPIESVSAHTTRFRDELGGEDTAALAFRYECGALGTFLSTHASGTWPPFPSFAAAGTDAMITVGGRHGAVELHRRGDHGEPEILLPKWEDPFVAMIRAYLDTIDGSPNPSPASLGLHQFKVVLAAYRAAEIGTAVRI